MLKVNHYESSVFSRLDKLLNDLNSHWLVLKKNHHLLQLWKTNVGDNNVFFFIHICVQFFRECYSPLESLQADIWLDTDLK